MASSTSSTSQTSTSKVTDQRMIVEGEGIGVGAGSDVVIDQVPDELIDLTEEGLLVAENLGIAGIGAAADSARMAAQSVERIAQLEEEDKGETAEILDRLVTIGLPALALAWVVRGR